MENKLRVFTRMNPLIFKRSKTAEDPQQLMEEVQKIMMAMGATDIQKFEMDGSETIK